MKAIVMVFAVLTLAGGAFAQQPQAYTTPGAEPGVPTFMNADVVRVNSPSRTITLRSENREVTLAVEGEALDGLSKVRPGDQVILGYRVDVRDGRSTQVVTNIRLVTETAPAPAASRSTTIQSVRVVRTNPSKRILTVTDETGARQVLSVTRAATSTLRRIRAGDDVVLSYTGQGRKRTVTRIEPVGASPGGVTAQVVATTGPVTTPSSTTITTTTTTVPPTVINQPVPAAPGGIPLPPNVSGAGAIVQPVPNVPAPTPTLNVALPPTTAGTLPEQATPAQVEAVRNQATRDFQAAAGVLALKANEIDGLWFAFKDPCLGGKAPAGAATTTGREWFVLLGGAAPLPADDACRQRLVDLTRAAELFQQQMDIARDAARKADVLAGTMREILQRNRLDR